MGRSHRLSGERMEGQKDPLIRLTALRLLHRVIADLNTARDLNGTLQAVVDGVVSTLGFELAAVNVIRPDGDLEVAAVAGSDEVRRVLAGQVGSGKAWERLFASAEEWGSLRFISHQVSPAVEVPDWIPDIPASDDPQAWHPHDVLLAPLSTPDDELIGVLSVDLPTDRRRPGRWQRELLEMFAAQAAIAIDNARLRAEALHAVAQLEQEQRALRASEESFRQAFENAPSGMAITSLQRQDRGRLLRVNEALCRILGYSQDALRWLGLPAVTHPDDRVLLAEHENSPRRTELRLVRSDGSSIWASLRASTVFDEDGTPHFLLTHVEDIEDRRRREQRLVHQARHDALTGLPNGAELRARLEAHLRMGDRLAVLFCDLDDFKGINDIYGHHVGDAVLVEVANRLAKAGREVDTVARIGGDEFVVLASGMDRGEAEDLAQRLSLALSLPVFYEGHDLPVAASFGVSWADTGATAEQLLRIADAQMYAQKRARARIGSLRAHRRAG